MAEIRVEISQGAPLEQLVRRHTPLSYDDALAAQQAVERFGRPAFAAMIAAAPPERARRLRTILRLADRRAKALRVVAPLLNRP